MTTKVFIEVTKVTKYTQTIVVKHEDKFDVTEVQELISTGDTDYECILSNTRDVKKDEYTVNVVKFEEHEDPNKEPYAYYIVDNKVYKTRGYNNIKMIDESYEQTPPIFE